MKTTLTILISLLSFACIGQSGGIKLSKSDTVGVDAFFITPNNYYKYYGIDTTISPTHKSKDTTFLPITNYGVKFETLHSSMPYFYNNTPIMVRIKGDTVVIESPQLKFIQIDGTTYEIIRKSELREVNKITKTWSNVYDTIYWFSSSKHQYIQKIKPKTK